MPKTTEPDWDGAIEAMIDKKWPALVTDGWYFHFPHTGNKMIATQSRQYETDEYTRDDFDRRYKERYGKKWRG